MASKRYSRQSLRGKSFSVGMRMEGDWGRLLNLTQSQTTQVIPIIDKAMLRSARKYMVMLKMNLNSGGGKFSYKRLSNSYSEKKEASGSNEGMFSLTNSMINAIDIYRTKRGMVAVGIKNKSAKRPSIKGFKSKMTIGDYARILEKGRKSGSIGGEQPARPIFSDTFVKQFKGRRTIKKGINKELIKFYRKHGIQTGNTI